MSLLLLVLAAALAGIGTYLVTQRLLSRVIIGLGLLGHGANLLIFFTSAGTGGPPLVGEEPLVADALPQALILTAIVITFGVTALLLALALRSYLLTGSDAVEDDSEDRRIGGEGA
jgi:multicomponent Na+:H+ antiporter subunit C